MLRDPNHLVGLVEGGIWLTFAYVPCFTLRHAGKAAFLALAAGLVAKTFADINFSLGALAYSARFSALFRIWSERRFAQKYHWARVAHRWQSSPRAKSATSIYAKRQGTGAIVAT